MKNRGRNNKKLSLGVGLALIALLSVALYIVVACVVRALEYGSAFNFFDALYFGLSDYRVWVIAGGAAAGIGVAFAIREMRSSRRVLKINDIEDSHWLTNAEVVKSPNMTLTSYSKLSDVADGVPVYAAKQGKDITVVLAKPIHTLTIGTTGSGKTTGFVDPAVQILCRTKTKPGIVLTDPKGELYRNHAATLEAQGYKVIVLDVAEPYKSARWNPFAAVIEKTKQIIEAKNTVIEPAEVVQQSGKYIDLNGGVHPTYDSAQYENQTIGEYAFAGTHYASEEQADNARNVFIQNLSDEIFIDIQDIVYTICPITSQQEPVWEQGARNFIFALALAMWEDLLSGTCSEIEFNLHTLYRNIADYAKGDNAVLAEYLSNGRSATSNAAGLANAVLASQDRQLSSYLSQVNNYIVGFADSGIRRLTSGNDIDLNTFDEQPTALFVKIPDEKENRHFLVTLLITQLYKVLVNKARENYRRGETKDEELKRNVYVIMDEFGNLPKFQSIDKIITVGRSRHIFMLPIIQDYGQLDNKYGKELAGIIRSNCNIKIFIGSTDPNTIKEFSELCGKTKQRHINFSDGMADTSFNVSTSAESVPLIYPSELEHLNDPPKVMGNAIVLAFGKNPIRSKYEPVFKNRNIYKPTDGVPENKVAPEVFDELLHYYNYCSRNLILERHGGFLDEQDELVRLLKNGSLGRSSPIPTAPDNSDASPPNALELAADRLYPRVVNIKQKLPEKLGVELENEFLDFNADGVITVCETVIEYAAKRGMRWLKAETVKLKNIVKQLAAKAPLKIQEQGVVNNDDDNN